MGKRPDEIAGEIRDLRRETDAIINELLRRARPESVARGVGEGIGHRAEAVTEGVSRRAEELVGEATQRAETVAEEVAPYLPEPVRRNPLLTAGAIVGLMAGAGVLLINLLRRPERTEPGPSAGYRLRSTMDELGESLARGAPGRGLGRTAPTPAWLGQLAVMGLAGVMIALVVALGRQLTRELGRSPAEFPRG